MKILWAVRVGDEDWAENVITEHEDRIPAAMEWAKANGFNRFRIAVVDDSKPDFTKTLTRR